MSLTQDEYIARNRAALGLSPGGADWAYHKLVNDRIGQPDHLAVIPAEPVVAILVGHTPFTGAFSVGQVDEWHYNDPVADYLIADLESRGIPAVRFERTDEDYFTAAEEYAAQINPVESFRAVIELHFNSGGGRGFEYVFAGAAGQILAQHLAAAHKENFPWQRMRHVDGTRPPFQGRGAGLLNAVRPAAAICEPFFGDNQEEWTKFEGAKQEYATSLADGLESFLTRK